VNCAYCGKEIGALRLLRDREFCSAEHRKKYGARLNRALHQIGEPEPAPAGVATFVIKLPVQDASGQRVLAPWYDAHCLQPTQNGVQWPVTLDPPISGRHKRAAAVPQSPRVKPVWTSLSAWRHTPQIPQFAMAPISFRNDPPEDAPIVPDGWMQPPAPQPVLPMVDSSVSIDSVACRHGMRVRSLRSEAIPMVSRRAPFTEGSGWVPLHGPEPVVCYLGRSAPAGAISPSAAAPRMLEFRMEAEPQPVNDSAVVESADAEEAAPAPIQGAMRVSEPEPVSAWVASATALDWSAALRLPRFNTPAEPLPVRDSGPAALRMPMPVPVPEPVFSFVQPAAAIDAFAGAPAAVQLPRFAMEAEPLLVHDSVPEVQDAPMRIPEPEPVFSFVQPAAAIDAFAAAPAAVQLPRFALEAEPLPAHDSVPEVQDAPMRIPEPEPVFSFVQPAAAIDEFSAAVRLPRFALEIEPELEADEPIAIPAACESWMAPAQPEPVFRFLEAATASHAAMASRNPSFDAVAMEATYLPVATNFRDVPKAEPVMAGVWPRMAAIHFAPIYGAAPIQLPEIGPLAELARPELETLQPAASKPAEPVETYAVPSRSLVPAAAAHVPLLAPAVSAMPAAAAAPWLQLAPAVAGPAPEPLESLLAVSAASQMDSATVVRLQPFAVAASEERTVPGFDAPRLAPAVIQPQCAAATLNVLRPIPTIAISGPQPLQHRPVPAIPRPGLLSLEFHAQRVRGIAGGRLEWKSSRFTPAPPRFQMRPVWDKAEDLVPRPAPVAVFPMKGKKRAAEHSAFTGYALKIAASIFVMIATWYGMGSVKVNRTMTARQDLTDPGTRLTGSNSPVKPSRSVSAGPATVVAKGPVTRLRESIARRAAVQYNDNLREGMEAWGAVGKTYRTGWTRNPDGYVRTGSLALFTPSLNFSDYRMEFFGQIESKSIGWTVRAKDPNNYHAMKFTVIEAGLRPIIAMVHYNVIDGKAGRKLQTPLNVMVHNNRPIQVAVNVKGNQFVTSIDGEEVDTYSDTTLASGGIGFFSDVGEKARLYWVKVSKNDDWLGHVCAFLSGVNGSSVTAEVWDPAPGAPLPGLPDGEHTALAGVWLGMPYCASRRARSKSRRLEWNS